MFLRKLLPSEGYYCVAMLLQSGGFRHFWYPHLDQAERQLSALNNDGHTVYIAQATFDPESITEAQSHNKALPKGHSRDQRKKERSQANAIKLKNFFLDIDCGEKWPLKNQVEGVQALKQFIADTDLPFPAVVNSGNGLYAHWILEEAIPASQWQTIAQLLKRVVAKYAPAIGGDSSRTSDSASVLRAPGTSNRKPGKPEKQVLLLKDAEPIPFMVFVRALSDAARRQSIDRTAVLPPKPATDINAEFSAGLDLQSVPSLADKIADNCAQLAAMRESGGNMSEPAWYACIGVLVHCLGAAEIIHQWSSGHPDYSQSQTDAKILQWQDAGIGPTTCSKFGEINAEKCIGCRSNGKIKSPIMLGRPEPVVKEVPEEQCTPPDGFKRGEDGLYAEEDGRWLRFYDQDLYPDALAYDESLGYEVMSIKHSLPHDGEMECTIRSSMVNDPKALMTLLSDNHIKVVGTKEKKYMTAYLEGYAARLQRQRRMSMLLCQMGWKLDRASQPIFVLGKKIFHADGRIEDASLARNVPKSAGGYHSAGSLDKWSEATEILDMPGMEPFAFALLAGGFGAPLMKFTGFDGALVSMYGQSGSGKTLMLRMAQSVWGFHQDLMMLRADTSNALIGRLGVSGNLPLTIDEVTNMEGMVLSDLVYQITQGREKVRLTRDAKERNNINTWNTLAVTTSNTSLVDKLSGAKHDASAEINRVFEYPVMEHSKFRDDVTERIFWTIHENYGHAGEIYAQWLVQNHKTIKRHLDLIKANIDCKAEITGDERFWSAVAAVSIYGGLVAQKLGLIRFNVLNVKKWVEATIWNMRTDKKDLAGDSIGILGQFIDDHAANRILVKNNTVGTGRNCIIVEPPRGALVMRYELDTRRLFFSRKVFQHWLAKRFGSYTQVKNDLQACGALLNPNARKTLGAGTFFGGSQQVVWEIDMRNRRLEPVAVPLVEMADDLAKDPRHMNIEEV